MQYQIHQTKLLRKTVICLKISEKKSKNFHILHLLKGVLAKNERGYRLNAIKKALLIATNLTSICVYKEKIVKND